MYITLSVAILAVTALIVLLAKKRETMSAVSVIGTVISFAFLVAAVAVGWGYMPGTMSGVHIDGFGGIVLVLIGLVHLLAIWASSSYLKKEIEEGIVSLAQVRYYYALIPLFAISMIVAVSVNSLGLMWIAIEGMTLATTMLVAFYTKGGSLEAAWKFILVCSAGIAIGLIGILLFYYAIFLAGGGSEAVSISWSGLFAAAQTLSPSLVKLAFVFIFIGFGTKVGLVPMHTWLPDTNSRAPSPVSGMLSGVGEAVALLIVYRAKTVVDAVLGSSDWTNGFFLFFGALSVLTPVFFMIRQKNYKRLLAYSSIEHMGLAVFALGFGAPGFVFAVIHIIGHAFLKSALFFGTGNILLTYKSTKFEKVSGLSHYLPRLAALFVFASVLLLAVPPSPLFISELGIMALGFTNHPALTAVVLLGTIIASVSFFINFMPMLFVVRESALPARKEVETWNTVHTTLLVGVVLSVLLGLFLIVGSGQEVLRQLISLA